MISHLICVLINFYLESGAVRDVIDHSKVVAPSTMEDFVSDCAMRDVFQRGVSSHLPAFNCSVGTQASLKYAHICISVYPVVFQYYLPYICYVRRMKK